jgi:hypothetical protein
MYHDLCNYCVRYDLFGYADTEVLESDEMCEIESI